MVNHGVTSAEVRASERNLALSYAPLPSRAALAALFALDQRLGDILRAAREPMIGQMRLTWWYEALVALDQRPPPAEPVLAALAAVALPRGVRGAALAEMVDGWEVLLDEPTPDDARMLRYAASRGGGLFKVAGQVLKDDDSRLMCLGEGWALADLAGHFSDPVVSARAVVLARSRLDRGGGAGRWSPRLRPLAALAMLAWSDLNGGMPGNPARIARLLALRLTGWGLRGRSRPV